MTQHPLELDPNRKEEEFGSLGDTWSRAEALLEELPRQRRRLAVRRAVTATDNRPAEGSAEGQTPVDELPAGDDAREVSFWLDESSVGASPYPLRRSE